MEKQTGVRRLVVTLLKPRTSSNFYGNVCPSHVDKHYAYRLSNVKRIEQSGK